MCSRNNDGFTLLEVLLAVVLMTAGVVALLQAMSIGLFGAGQSADEIIAANLAQEKIEDIRNKSFSSVVNEAKAALSGFSPFQRQVAVTTPITGLKQVTVTMYWTAKSDEVSENFVTYVSDI